MRLYVIFPRQVVFFGRLDDAIAHALGIVTGHHELHGGKKGSDERLFLIVEILADALFDGNGGALEFQHAEGDAVDIEHDVGALGVGAGDGDLFSDGKVVFQRVRPIDQVDGLGVLADADLDLAP